MPLPRIYASDIKDKRNRRKRVPVTMVRIYWGLLGEKRRVDLCAELGITRNELRSYINMLKQKPHYINICEQTSPCCFKKVNLSHGFFVCTECGNTLCQEEQMTILPFNRSPTSNFVSGKALGSPTNFRDLNKELYVLKKRHILKSLAPWHILNIDDPITQKAMTILCEEARRYEIAEEELEYISKQLRKRIKALIPQTDVLAAIVAECLQLSTKVGKISKEDILERNLTARRKLQIKRAKEKAEKLKAENISSTI